MRVGELVTAMKEDGGGMGGDDQAISDAQITATCETCGTRQTLDEARVESNGDTVYFCTQGCEAPVTEVRRVGAGYSLIGKHDLEIDAPGTWSAIPRLRMKE